MGALPRIFLLQGNWLRRATMLLGPPLEEEEFQLLNPENEQRLYNASGHIFDEIDAQFRPRLIVNELELQEFRESTTEWINSLQEKINDSSKSVTEGIKLIHHIKASNHRPKSTLAGTSSCNGSLYVETPRSVQKRKPASFSITPHSNNTDSKDTTVRLNKAKSKKLTNSAITLSTVKKDESTRSNASKGRKVRTGQNTAKKKQHEDATPSRNPPSPVKEKQTNEQKNMYNQNTGTKVSDDQLTEISPAVSSAPVKEMRVNEEETECPIEPRPVTSNHNNDNKLIEGFKFVSPEGGGAARIQLRKRKSPTDTFKVPDVPKKSRSSKNTGFREKTLVSESSANRNDKNPDISNSNNNQLIESSIPDGGAETKMRLRQRKSPMYTNDKGSVSKRNATSKLTVPKGDTGASTKVNFKKNINGSLGEKCLDVQLSKEGKKEERKPRKTKRASPEKSSVIQANKVDTSLWSTGSKISSTPIIKKKEKRTTMSKTEQVKNWLFSQSNKSSYTRLTKGNKDTS